MCPAKNLGEGRGLRKILGGRVKKFHEILQQICENLECWPKNFPKMPFFCQIFPFLSKKNLLGIKAKYLFRWRVKANHPPPSSHLPPG
jgi:hypothetical protein